MHRPLTTFVTVLVLACVATARAHDLTLVTHDTAELSRVVGLRLEDWEIG